MPWPRRGSFTSLAMGPPDKLVPGTRHGPAPRRPFRPDTSFAGCFARETCPDAWHQGPSRAALPLEGSLDRLKHVLAVRHDVLLHHRREGKRRELRAYA